MSQTFDVIVIGGGHAGAEAARAAARGGSSVAMITLLRDAIGRMSCNPAIGGLAKGHLVKELDAMGGLMPEAADAAGIQFKVLNRSKGPAVQGPRAQCDRDRYATAVQDLLSVEPNLTILEGSVSRIVEEHGHVTAVELASGERLGCRAVVVTTGTFLRALMHSGEVKKEGGRWGEPSAVSLSDSLRELGLTLGRLKTGTPPRVLRHSVDLASLEEAPGDKIPRPFSILTDSIRLPQVLCWITHTSTEAHELIRRNLHRAPMYSGQIDSTGPRYCPSIEDKVVRFAEKERHQVFVEPEGLDTDWLYLNGISTSLPPDVQDQVVRSMPGFSGAVIARYGYAVEYDFANPEQLSTSLEAREVKGLFLAGQINGTSGYEEAAAQGFVAGVNAALMAQGREPFTLSRSQAYAGVMIDDLVTLGTEEPYRMFTSRAEHRLLLGCDSVYERLTPLAEPLGTVDRERVRRVQKRTRRMSDARNSFGTSYLKPDSATLEWLASVGATLSQPTTLASLAQRADVDLMALLQSDEGRVRFPEASALLDTMNDEEKGGVMAQLRYAGYLARQEQEAERLREGESWTIPADFDYRRPGLSTEVIEKLSRSRPANLAQAARVRGVTPAAISILRMHLRPQRGATQR